MSSSPNLTILEVDALSDVAGGLNLTDGHARLDLTSQQSAIVARLPKMFALASQVPFPEVEVAAQRAFLNAVGQHSAPVGSRILSCYSSTLATDIVARALPAGSTIAVLHPTFDNIADLFRTRGLNLIPMTEDAMLRGDWPGAPVDSVVLTHPNNPTGLVTPPERLRSLAEHAARHRQTVIIDASFRGQVPAAQYDCYAILEAAGADWIIIEDTGKLWPTHELKIGFLAFSERHRLSIERAFSESLLAASPVVLQLVEALAKDWICGGFERASDLIERNRATVAEAVGSVGLALADPNSRISVARIDLPDNGPDSELLHKDLLARGVHVLPCAPFHWANPVEGLRYVRVSLARPHDTVRVAAAALADSYRSLSVQT